MNIEDIDIFLIDHNTMAVTKEILEDSFDDMFAIYIEDVNAAISKVESGLQSLDPQTISQAVHPIKSSSASMGFTGIFLLSDTAESCARELLEKESVSKEDLQCLCQVPELMKKSVAHIQLSMVS